MKLNPMKPITVRILVSITDDNRFDAQTLCFDTVRTGFPTARICVDINGHPSHKRLLAQQKAEHAGCFVNQLIEVVHHADWIRNCVEGHAPSQGTLVICDADTLFWKSCEDWWFPSGTLLAGYRVPRIFNDFARCISVERIHTSMMVIPDAVMLTSLLKQIYRPAGEQCGEYCPCDPYMPAVRFINGEPIFWDSCANLYQMLSKFPGATCGLGTGQFACFDHLNSASFYDVMAARMDDPSGFKFAHNELVKTPEKLRGLWPIINSYYQQKHIQALQHERVS